MKGTLLGPVLAQVAKTKGTNGDINGDGKVKYSMFASDEPFGRGLVAGFTAAMSAADPQAILESVYFNGNHDVNDIAYYADVFSKLTDGHNETTGESDGPTDLILGFSFPDQLVALIKSQKLAASTTPILHAVALATHKTLASLGSDAEGQEGIGAVLWEDAPAGEVFYRDFKAETGLPPATYNNANYDSAVIMSLAALMAARDLEDPSTVTGAQIRDQIRPVSTPGGHIIYTGVDEYFKAVQHIEQGEDINYEGASGPCDFDEEGNVMTGLMHFVIENADFKSLDIYDCAQSSQCPRR